MTRMGTLARTLAGAALLALAAAAGAQTVELERADWKEDAPPPPPSYSLDHLIEIEMPRTSTVKMGVDPATISVNVQTGIVRYVVVTRGSSAVNATYEGIRCATAEYRVYARQVQGSPWTPSTESAWKPMMGQNTVMVRHPYQLARGGLCNGTTVRHSVAEIVRALKTGDQVLYYRIGAGARLRQHQVVPVHHLGPAAVAQQLFDVAGRPAAQQARLAA